MNQYNMVPGLPRLNQFDPCEACIYDKMCKLPFKSGKSWRAKERLPLVHADVCRSMQEVSLGENRYFLLFVDDFSRMSWVLFFKNNYEVFQYF